MAENDESEEMRPRVPWMTKNDISILEWLDQVDLPAPPKQIHLTMDSPPSYTTINRRLRNLEDMEMVEKHPEAAGYYRISEKGRRYLHDPDAEAEEFMPDGEDDEDEEEEDEDDLEESEEDDS